MKTSALCTWFLPLLLFALTHCEDEDDFDESERSRPVKISNLVDRVRAVKLQYIGTTGSQSIKKYSFKIPGKIEKVYVEKGEKIEKGQKLAELNKKEVRFALKASRLDVHKASDAYAESERFHLKAKKLLDQGVIDRANFDKATLDRDIKKSIRQQAGVALASKKSMVADAEMVSDLSGYVVEILNEPGEVIGAGYPVIIVRGETQVVNVGVSQADVKKLALGTRAEIQVDGARGTGSITKISQIPEKESRTYNVEVSLSGEIAENSFYIGSIAHVNFEIGEEAGIWIPINAILTDGVDYVFAEEDQRAVRKNITIGPVSGSEVRVLGLQAGDNLVIDGMKGLKEGYLISPMND